MTNVQALPEKWREPEQVAAKRPRMERIVRWRSDERLLCDTSHRDTLAMRNKALGDAK